MKILSFIHPLLCCFELFLLTFFNLTENENFSRDKQQIFMRYAKTKLEI